ncbi:MAG: ankyrin repeat domain-containing protein [Pseudomonadota bacterium]
MKAALNGHLETTRQLLIADAAVNLTDKGGYSAMMLAASNNHVEIVELLLNEGADVDQVENTNGWTALIWAAKQGHLHTVQILLHHQADPDLQDFQGKRAMDWATDGGFAAIVSLINSSK